MAVALIAQVIITTVNSRGRHGDGALIDLIPLHIAEQPAISISTEHCPDRQELVRSKVQKPMVWNFRIGAAKPEVNAEPI